MGPHFIDFEAFQYQGQYKIKELCIIDVDKPLTPLYYVFDSPSSWRELDDDQQYQYSYQTRKIHHLKWHEGDNCYCANCVMYHIKNDFPYWCNGIFYVMDCYNGQKVKFLMQEFPELNIVNYNVTFKQLPYITRNITCLHRDHGVHCAYLKCMRLCYHYMNACPVKTDE